MAENAEFSFTRLNIKVNSQYLSSESMPGDSFCITLYNPGNNTKMRYYYFHFTDEVIPREVK